MRNIAAPEGRDCTPEDIAQALSVYIKLFDRLMKSYLGGALTARDVESEYCADLNRRMILI